MATPDRLETLQNKGLPARQQQPMGLTFGTTASGDTWSTPGANASQADISKAAGEKTPAQAAQQAAAPKWSLEGDPIYQQSMAYGQSAFNRARANALANVQNQETAANRQLANMKQSAAGSRRQLAGNFASRGMQRGAYGAYYRAQDQANAADIAAQTSVKDQLAQVNQDFLANYGAIGTDWTGTTIGQDYRNQAIQQALAAKLAQYGAA